ncbi:MAG: helix-turn-helix transcriptional regulator [Streptosporangiaceae bacterium]
MPTSARTASALVGYLASALTGLSGEARTEVFAISDVVAGVCADTGIDLYQPRKSTDPVHHSGIPDDEVFRLDRERVAGSDLLIHLAHHPSTGAGQELVIAKGALVPIIVLAAEGALVSRMVTGLPGVLVVRHHDLPTLAERLARQIEELRPTLTTRRAAFAVHDRPAFGSRLKELRQARGLTEQGLVAAMRVPELISVRELRDWESSSDRESNLHLVQIREIAAALNVSPADLLT